MEDKESTRFQRIVCRIPETKSKKRPPRLIFRENPLGSYHQGGTFFKTLLRCHYTLTKNVKKEIICMHEILIETIKEVPGSM